MAKKNEALVWSELIKVGLYKRNQGRLARQLTAAALMLVVALGCWRMSQGPMAEYDRALRIGLPTALAAVGIWCAYRLVNYPVFANFLIDVEGEMGKVSWASRQELARATVVVLVTMFFLSFVLFIYDMLWQIILRWINVLQI